MNVLFVCLQNWLRSPTAAFIYSKTDGIDARSAGINTDLTREDIEWADTIFVMEKAFRHTIRKRYPDLYETKQIICLYVDDIYDYLEPALINLLAYRLSPLLPEPSIPSQDEIDAAIATRKALIGE